MLTKHRPDFTQDFAASISNPDSSSTGRNTALITGSVALGAYLTGLLFRRVNRSNLTPPSSLPPALDAPVRSLELMEGSARFYERPGEGIPLVMLHSFNAAASSFEMKPLFEHLARTTARPLYALDWFGFGLSDRPPIRYRPDLYFRQLRRFLSEYLHEAADLVALSLGCEYAAVIAAEAPFLVRRLVLIAPTNLVGGKDGSLLQQALLGIAEHTGAFELLFYRLTRRTSLREFYAHQVFLNESDVPDELVDYAFQTSHVVGAHYAPRRFIDGSLFLGARALEAYASLHGPTLLIAPEHADGLVQSFEGLDALQHQHPEHLRVERVPTGLLPHWETSSSIVPEISAFLADAD